MAWSSTDLPGAKIDQVDSSQVFPLGTRCKARNRAASTGWEGEFIYMKGVASCAAGQWVMFHQDDYSTALLAKDHLGPVGVAMAATIASTFGWFQIAGKATAALAASCADNAALYTTATAGTVDDASSSQSEVVGARAASAVTSAADGEVEIFYPHCLVE
jgi:hypothetical protein